jgi:biotin carboxyl carrier protein
MADELKVQPPGPRRLRVTFAPGAAGSTRGAEGAVIDASHDGTVTVDGIDRQATLELLVRPRARLTTEAGAHDVLVTPLPDARRTAAGVERVEIVVDGWRFEIDVEPERHAHLRERATTASRDGPRGGPVELRAIIPGRVVSVDVAEGDTVEAGERLLVLEAMKMQNELRAVRAGRIGRVHVGVGQTVELGELLLVIE